VIANCLASDDHTRGAHFVGFAQIRPSRCICNALTIGSSDRGVRSSLSQGGKVDDLYESVSFRDSATARRSTSSLEPNVCLHTFFGDSYQRCIFSPLAKGSGSLPTIAGIRARSCNCRVVFLLSDCHVVWFVSHFFGSTLRLCVDGSGPIYSGGILAIPRAALYAPISTGKSFLPCRYVLYWGDGDHWRLVMMGSNKRFERSQRLRLR
jgi:hypothetical protein